LTSVFITFLPAYHFLSGQFYASPVGCAEKNAVVAFILFRTSLNTSKGWDVNLFTYPSLTSFEDTELSAGFSRNNALKKKREGQPVL